MKLDVVIPRSWSLGLACPACGRKTRLPEVNGNTIAMPLTCEHCNHRFRPRFYCPDHKAPKYHVFEAESLYLDNLHSLYTFCPEHTYTTYDLAQAVPPNGRGFAQARAQFVGFLNALLFRLALTLELARQRISSIFRRPLPPPPPIEQPGPFSPTRK